MKGRILALTKKLPRVKLKALLGPGLLGLAVVLVVTWFSNLDALRPVRTGEEITLSRVNEMARAKTVGKARFLDEDATVLIQPTDATTFTSYTRYPKSDGATADLIDRLDAAGADVAIDPQDGKATKRFTVQFLMPLLILASIFSFFFLLITGQSGGASEFFAFSKSLAKMTRRKKGKGEITFADVAAVDEAIIELREAVDYLTDPTKFEAMGAKAPKGILLVGPPGTGKTLLAKATAGEANVPFFSMAGSEFVEALVGVGAARVRDLFRMARQSAPCLVFIDELDAAGRQRGAGVGQGNDEREQTLNQMLAEMDGFDVASGIVVMARPTGPTSSTPRCCVPGASTARSSSTRPT